MYLLIEFSDLMLCVGDVDNLFIHVCAVYICVYSVYVLIDLIIM